MTGSSSHSYHPLHGTVPGVQGRQRHRGLYGGDGLKIMSQALTWGAEGGAEPPWQCWILAVVGSACSHCQAVVWGWEPPAGHWHCLTPSDTGWQP